MVRKLILLMILFIQYQVCCSSDAVSLSEKDKPGQLLIFVSFSMPKTSLHQWATQAEKAGGVLVFKGLRENSIKETLSTVKSIFGEKHAKGIIIDPTAFERYGIKSVPAVLVSDKTLASCDEKNCPVSRFDVVFGDVGLKYALEKLYKDGELNNYAEFYLKRLNA